MLNLSTYETFYPEKRPFFLEGAALFAAPIQALYTRRIGRLPDAPVVPDGETVRTAQDPSRLWTAAKLTGTAGSDTQIGMLAALTGENRVATDDASGSRERVADPWSGYAALRVRRGLGERGYVGAFATVVGRFETGDYPMVGSQVLCPDGSLVVAGVRCTHDALVAGVDARWRSKSGAYLVESDVAASTVRGGPPRVQRDGVVIASGDSSPQARVRAAKQNNGPVFDIVVEADGRRFDVNDAGYLERANFIHTDWNVGWKTTTPGRLVRESTTFAEYFYWRNWRGETINGGYQLNTQVVFANYWQMFTELHWRPSRFDDREVGDGTALQRRGRREPGPWLLAANDDDDPRDVARGVSALPSLRVATVR